LLQEKLKTKPMTPAELTLAIDRLTRFKFPETKYNRVFKEMISKHLILPKISYKEYENLDEETVCRLVEKIFENSLSAAQKNLPCELYKKVIEMERKTFLINEQTQKLMQAKVPYEAILDLNKSQPLSSNLELLRHLAQSQKTLTEIRTEFSTKFPIEKIVLAEGITEEILLPKFASILGFDFDKNGITVIPAGGKNQVAKDYLEFHHRLNIPVIILLDADAKAVAETISSKLRSIDKLILIKKGEFEDILPVELIEKAINNKFLNFFKASKADFTNESGRVKNLEELYRINGLGEFKKAEFAHNVEAVLNSNTPDYISDEIKNIVDEIKNLPKS